MSRFTELDEAIVGKIASGRTRFVQLSYNTELIGAATLLVGMSGSWRLIDRRLQALRKSGRIAFDSKQGWTVLPLPPAGSAQPVRCEGDGESK